MIKPDGFTLFTDHFQFLEFLSMEQRGELLTALFKYAESKEEIDSNNDLLKTVFLVFKKKIDVEFEKYQATVERNRRNGAKGGAPKGNQNAAKSNPNNPPVVFSTQTSQQEQEQEQKQEQEQEQKQELKQEPEQKLKQTFRSVCSALV